MQQQCRARLFAVSSGSGPHPVHVEKGSGVLGSSHAQAPAIPVVSGGPSCQWRVPALPLFESGSIGEEGWGIMVRHILRRTLGNC